MCDNKNSNIKEKMQQNIMPDMEMPDLDMQDMYMQQICPMMHQSGMYSMPKGCPMMNSMMWNQHASMYQMHKIPMQYQQMPMYYMPKPYMPPQCMNNIQMDMPMMQMEDIKIRDWYEEYESEDSSEDTVFDSSDDYDYFKMEKKHHKKPKHLNPCFYWPPCYYNPYKTEEYYEERD